MFETCHHEMTDYAYQSSMQGFSFDLDWNGQSVGARVSPNNSLSTPLTLKSHVLSLTDREGYEVLKSYLNKGSCTFQNLWVAWCGAMICVSARAHTCVWVSVGSIHLKWVWSTLTAHIPGGMLAMATTRIFPNTKTIFSCSSLSTALAVDIIHQQWFCYQWQHAKFQKIFQFYQRVWWGWESAVK